MRRGEESAAGTAEEGNGGETRRTAAAGARTRGAQRAHSEALTKVKGTKKRQQQVAGSREPQRQRERVREPGCREARREPGPEPNPDATSICCARARYSGRKVIGGKVGARRSRRSEARRETRQAQRKRQQQRGRRAGKRCRRTANRR